MNIENVKAATETVKKRIKSDYRVTPHVSGIIDDLCDSLIQRLEAQEQNVLNGPLLMTDEQVAKLAGGQPLEQASDEEIQEATGWYHPDPAKEPKP